MRNGLLARAFLACFLYAAGIAQAWQTDPQCRPMQVTPLDWDDHFAVANKDNVYQLAGKIGFKPGLLVLGNDAGIRFRQTMSDRVTTGVVLRCPLSAKAPKSSTHFSAWIMTPRTEYDELRLSIDRSLDGGTLAVKVAFRLPGNMVDFDYVQQGKQAPKVDTIWTATLPANELTVGMQEHWEVQYDAGLLTISFQGTPLLKRPSNLFGSSIMAVSLHQVDGAVGLERFHIKGQAFAPADQQQQAFLSQMWRLESQINLAYQAGKFAEVVKYAPEAIRRQQIIYRQEFPATRLEDHYIAALSQTGRLSDAITYSLACADRYEKQFGDNHPMTSRSRITAARSYRLANQDEQALTIIGAEVAKLSAYCSAESGLFDAAFSLMTACSTSVIHRALDEGRLVDAAKFQANIAELIQQRLGKDAADRREIALSQVFTKLAADAADQNKDTNVKRAQVYRNMLHNKLPADERQVATIQEIWRWSSDEFGPDAVPTLHAQRAFGRSLVEAGTAEQRKQSLPILTDLLTRIEATLGSDCVLYVNTLQGIAIQESDADQPSQLRSLKRFAQCRELLQKIIERQPQGEPTYLLGSNFTNAALTADTLSQFDEATYLALQALVTLEFLPKGKHVDQMRIGACDILARALDRSEFAKNGAKLSPAYKLALSRHDSRQASVIMARFVLLSRLLGSHAEAQSVETTVLDLAEPADDLLPGLLVLAHHALAMEELKRQNYASASLEFQAAWSKYLLVWHQALSSTFLDQRSVGLAGPRTAVFQAFNFPPAMQLKDRELYLRAMQWKGSALSAQLRLRAARDTVELAQPFKALTNEVDWLMTACDGPIRDTAELSQHWQQATRIEQKMAQAFPDALLPDMEAAIREIQVALPKDAVYLDLIGYPALPEPWNMKQATDGYVDAFVIRNQPKIERVRLCSAKVLMARLEAWYQSMVQEAMATDPQAQAGARRKLREHGMELKRLVWEPLQVYVQDAKTVLVCPAPLTSQIPLHALPGTKPDTYLLDEHSFVTVPATFYLQQLLYRTPNDLPPHPQFLLATQIAYGKSAHPAFVDLPIDEASLATRRDSFKKAYPNGALELIRGADATEGNFKTAATRSHFIHLDTHGFSFPTAHEAIQTPVEQRFAMNAIQRGLAGLSLSGMEAGLALAHANDFTTLRDHQDGILWSREASLLDLRAAEIVALAACDAALVDADGLAGVFGMQRNFHLAGAKSIVAPLWTVGNALANTVYAEFYKNLWDAKLPRGEALRQAQLKVLYYFDEASGQISSKRRTAPLPVYHWAPYVLSGDWR